MDRVSTERTVIYFDHNEMTKRVVTAVPISDQLNATAQALKEDQIRPMDHSEVSAYKPYTQLAAIAYCPPDKIANWQCGSNCDAHTDFKLYTTEGNGHSIPIFYVGYSPSLDSVIVSHEGTDPTKIRSLLIDLNFFWDSLNPSLHPGMSKDIKAHDGFTNAHDRSANIVLANVRKALDENKTQKVTLIGHSLGGAIAVLSAVYLQHHLPPSTTFKIVTFGQPRVGNQEFADYVDATFKDYSRITNKKDIVPILVGNFFGFRHAATNSEKHIGQGEWVECLGRENTHKSCAKGVVPNIIVGNTIDHYGPYDGISIGSDYCF